MVYIAGMNRIRYFFQEVAPASRPYFVLPIYDDGPALYRSIGTGMRRKRPKFELLHLTVQTQGIVGIVTAVVAAGCGALAASPAGNVMAWLGAILAFLVTLVALPACQLPADQADVARRSPRASADHNLRSSLSRLHTLRSTHASDGQANVTSRSTTEASSTSSVVRQAPPTGRADDHPLRHPPRQLLQ
jgi:hypothetical protein